MKTKNMLALLGSVLLFMICLTNLHAGNGTNESVKEEEEGKLVCSVSISSAPTTFFTYSKSCNFNLCWEEESCNTTLTALTSGCSTGSYQWTITNTSTGCTKTFTSTSNTYTVECFPAATGHTIEYYVTYVQTPCCAVNSPVYTATAVQCN